MKKENDGLINWVEPPNIGFLPKEIEDDTLSVMIRLLIAKVKEDHAMMQYKKELKHYAKEIIQIVKFAQSHGYKSLNVGDSSFERVYEQSGLKPSETSSSVSSSSDIVDGDPGDIIVEDMDFLQPKNKKKKPIDYSKIVDG